MLAATPEQLFARFLANGDEHALAVLFRRVSPALRAFALRLGVPRDRVDEAVHETLVAAVQQAPSFDDARPFLPWLQGILARKAASLLRDELRRARHHAAFAEQAPRTAPQPIDGAIGGEVRALLTQAIAAVPEHYRAALELHLLHGMSAGEVARRLGRNRVTVRVHLFRGLRALRQQLPRGLAPLLLAAVLPMRSATAGTGGAAARRIAFAGLAVAAALPIAVAGGWMQAGRQDAAMAALPATRSAAAAPSVADPVRLGDPPRAPGSPLREDAQLAGSDGFTVTVRDRDGVPVRGVGIGAEPACGEPPLPQRRFAVTGDDGVARFAPWPWTTVALHCDRGVATEAATKAGAAELRVDGGELHGMVVDAGGRPAAGAAIWLAAPGESAIGGGVVATAADDGTFALAAVPVGSWLGALTAAGVARPRPWREGAAVLTLEPGGEVSGRVVDGEGRPIAEALVVAGVCPELADLGFPGGVVAATAPTQLVRSDAAGCFGPLWLPAGVHALRVLAAGFRPTSRFVPVGASDRASCVLDLVTATRCTGEIVDGLGRPIPRADIVLRGDADDQRVDLAAGDDGRFAFDLPAAGTVSFCVRAPGFVPVRRVIADPAALRIVLAPQQHLRGRLLWPDGSGVAGFEVRWVVAASSALAEPEQRTQSDADGWFAVAEVDGRCRVCVRAVGDPIWHELPLSWAAAEPRLEVPYELRPTARLAGHVRAVGGEPYAGARIFVRCHSRIAWEVARSGRDGGFVVPAVPPGAAWVFAEPSTPDQVAAMADCTLLAGATTELELIPVAGGRLRYRLARTDAVGIDTALVTIVGGTPERRYAAHAAANGTQALPPGDYRLYAMGEGFAWVDGVPFRIEAGGECSLDLAVEPAARTVLALRGVHTLWGEGAELRLTRLGHDRPSSVFTLQRDAHPAVTAFLPAGEFEAVIETAGGHRYGCTFGIGMPPSTPAPRVLEFRRR